MEQKTDDLKTLVKYGKIDLVLKLALLVGAGFGGYFGYLYAVQEREKFRQTINEYEKKLAKIPFIGKSFS